MRHLFAALLAHALIGAIAASEAAAPKKKKVLKRDHYGRHVNENN